MSLALAVISPSLGCVGSAAVEAEVVAAPRLVWLAPGVWVVEDYDRAVYFYDDYYWWYSAGIWYRSPYYDGAFVRVRIAPVPIVRVYRPRVHVRYRAPRGVRVREAPRRRTRPKVRDNRSPKKRR